MNHRTFSLQPVIVFLLVLAGSEGIDSRALAAAPSSGGIAAKGTGPGLAPRFEPAGGIFIGRVSVRLASPVPDGVVRYTVDGSEPTAQSAVAGTAFSVIRSTLVKARVFLPGQPPGPMFSQTYTLADSEIKRFKSNLPLVVINSFGREIQHETKNLISVRFIDAPPSGSTGLEDAGLDVRAEVWLRGKSSLRYLKRSHGLKTRDDEGKARSLSVLGFPADSDWILYAPYPDKTLLRDVLAYDLSNQIGRYASRTRFVEVFVNEGGGRLKLEDYMGVYVLEEKIKRAPARVNVQKLGTNDNAEPNVTGGYIFKKDHNATIGEVEPSVDGRPHMGGGNAPSRYGYPTGPGGFPGDPAGFLPPVGGVQRTTRKERRPLPPQPDEGVPRLPFEGGRLQREVIVREGRPIVVERQFEPGAGGGMRRGGFMPGRGWSTGVEESFYTSDGAEFYYVEPKEDEITPAQKRWLQNHLNEFERVLYGPDFANPRKGYAAYIDVDSFIDFHLIVEVTKNIDGFRFSTYFQKDRGGLIKAEPIWDWNLSFGNANGKQGWMAEHWYWPQLDDQQYSYYRRLFEDPDFAQRYVDRWGVLRRSAFSVSNVLSRIDAHVAALGEARIRNFERWPILGRRIWPNYYVGQTYQDELSYLKNWTSKRLAWIDAQFVAPPEVSTSTQGNQRFARFRADRGRVLFTSDGSDPRLPGGGRSPQALEFAEPVPLKAGTKLCARVLRDNRWSPPVRL